jgi:hypothetical protein
MSGILSIPATIWKFQIVRFWSILKGNNSVILDSSCKKENAVSDLKFTGIANGAILDHIVDVNKSIISPWRFVV